MSSPYYKPSPDIIPAHKCPPLEILGRNVRRHRTKRGFTLYGLGELADISGRNLWNIEMGRVKPRVTTLKKIASAMGISSKLLLREPKRS